MSAVNITTYSVHFFCGVITPVPDTPNAMRVRKKNALYIAQYTSLKDAIISLIDGKVRHEYDRPKVRAARESVAAIAHYSTVPMCRPLVCPSQAGDFPLFAPCSRVLPSLTRGAMPMWYVARRGGYACRQVRTEAG